MRALIFVLALSVVFPALADDALIYQSPKPTCDAFIMKYGFPRAAHGYLTFWQTPTGEMYARQCDFMNDRDAGSLSDIGLPTSGFPNRASQGGAAHFKVLSGGAIKLY